MKTIGAYPHIPADTTDLPTAGRADALSSPRSDRQQNTDQASKAIRLNTPARQSSCYYANPMSPTTAQPRPTFPAAVHVLFKRGDHLLLSLRRNTGYEDEHWGLVAGHLAGDESVIDAASREAHEETGAVVSRSDITIVGVMHRRSDIERIEFFTICTRWSGEIINMEPDKCGSLAWHFLDDLPPNTIPYIRQALEYYHRYRTIDGLWFAEPDFPS